MVGEHLFPGVARNERGAVCRAFRLGAQNPALPLGFLLARAEPARHLDRDVGIRQINGEVADLGVHQAAHLAAPQLLVEEFPLGLWLLPETRGTPGPLTIVPTWARDSPLTSTPLFRCWSSRRRSRTTLAGFSAVIRSCADRWGRRTGERVSGTWPDRWANRRVVDNAPTPVVCFAQ